MPLEGAVEILILPSNSGVPYWTQARKSVFFLCRVYRAYGCIEVRNCVLDVVNQTGFSAGLVFEIATRTGADGG
jgi:hypothetical protein